MAAESIVDIVHLLRLLPLHELEGQLLVVDVGGTVAAPVPAAAAELTSRLTAQLRGGALDVNVMLHQLRLLRNIFSCYPQTVPFAKAFTRMYFLIWSSFT